MNDWGWVERFLRLQDSKTVKKAKQHEILELHYETNIPAGEKSDGGGVLIQRGCYLQDTVSVDP